VLIVALGIRDVQILSPVVELNENILKELATKMESPELDNETEKVNLLSPRTGLGIPIANNISPSVEKERICVWLVK